MSGEGGPAPRPSDAGEDPLATSTQDSGRTDGVDPRAETALDAAADSLETAPLAPPDPLETAEVGGGAAPQPASWKDRLRARLRAHEHERGEVMEDGLPPPLASERFRFLRELGRGGMGAVFLAEDRVLRRQVAVKVLLAGELATEEARERFEVEARAAARLRHRNVVAVHEVGDEGGRRFLVMDYVPGESLEKTLAREGTLPAREAARIVAQLADALAAAHGRAVLHRDVKPANVLLDADGVPLLTDFGLAKEQEAGSPVLTSEGRALGTPAYMAPEQVRGQSDLQDRRVDVYALGATLFHLVTGQPPFGGDSLAAVLQAVLNDPPPEPCALRPGLPRDLQTICLACLEKEPDQRYPTARALGDDLERFLSDRPILARPPGAGERAAKWLRRNRAVAQALAAAAGLAAVILAAGAAAFVHQLDQARRRQQAVAEQARAALETMIYRVRDDLREHAGPRVRRFRLELLRSAMEQLEALRAQDQAVAGDAAKVAAAHDQLAQLALAVGELDRAQASSDASVTAARAWLAAGGEEGPAFLITALTTSAEVAQARGEHPVALALLSEGVGLAERAAAQRPGDPDRLATLVSLRSSLARVQRMRGDSEAALEAFAAAGAALQGAELARAAPETIRNVMTARAERALLLAELGQTAQALTALEAVVEQARRQLHQRSDSAWARSDLADALRNLGQVRRQAGELPQAVALYREALALQRAALLDDPAHAGHRRGLTVTLNRIGDVQTELGELTEAARAYAESTALRRAHLAQDPESPELRRDLSVVLESVVDLRLRQGDAAAAQEALDEVLALRRALAPRDRRARIDLGGALAKQGQLRQARRELGLARQSFAEAVAVLRSEVHAGGDPLGRMGLVIALMGGGEVAEASGELDAALSAYGEAVAAAEDMVRLDPDHVDYLRNRSAALARHGNVNVRRRDFLGALADFSTAAENHRRLAAVAPVYGPEAAHIATTALEVRKVCLTRDLLEPETPFDQGVLAAFAQTQGAHAQAVEHYRLALADPELQRDLIGATYYNAACAAARAAEQREDGAQRDALLALGLEWLRGDVDQRREALAKLEASLAAEEDPQRRAALAAERRGHLSVLAGAREQDADLRLLRGLDGFEGLFGGEAPAAR